MSRFELAYSMASHAGRVRHSNQDCCAASPEHGVFVVCDGMGGAAAGELASRLAAATFIETIAGPAGPATLNGAPLQATSTAPERLAAAVHQANYAVYRKAAQTRHLRGMGSTLVSVLAEHAAAGDRIVDLFIVHVGDSRCYLLREGGLRLLTVDHSLVEEQVQAGYMSRDEADQSPVRNVITRAVGSRAHVNAEIQSVHAVPGDLLLLTTDGLSRELSGSEIQALLTGLPPAPNEHDLQAACLHLIDAANASGGRDNLTVLLLSLR